MALEGLGIEIAIFLFTAFLAYYVSVRIGLTVVVGEILLGIALGPSLFNLVQYNEGVQLIGELGAILLLFVVGLEVDFKDIYTVNNFLIALAGVLVPFAGGFLLTWVFGYTAVEALFMGTALTATSIAITAYVLRELGHLNSAAAKAIIGAAVVDDVLALLMLSITASVSEGAFSLVSIIVKIIIAVAFVLGSVLIRPLVRRIMVYGNTWAKRRSMPKVTIILAMAFAFALSAIADLIGLSAIVGSFMAGVIMHGLRIDTVEEGAQYLEMVFAAIFFVSIGILVDIHQIVLSIFFFLFIGLSFVTKVLGCGIVARLRGFSIKDSAVVGFGMMPRGEIALVVALVGITSGILDQTLYGAVLAMTLVTTLIAPIALGLLIRAKTKI